MAMHWAEVVLLVLLVLAVVGWLLWRQANRIDKLHRKVVASRIAVDGQLIRRAGASVDLAASHQLDPASAVMLAEAGYEVIDDLPPAPDPNQAMWFPGLGVDREAHESALSACLREVFPDEAAVAIVVADPIGEQILTALATAWNRAILARRLHNQAVAEARASRRHWWVRLFHLAGHAPLPDTFELDDAMPPALANLPTMTNSSPTMTSAS